MTNDWESCSGMVASVKQERGLMREARSSIRSSGEGNSEVGEQVWVGLLLKGEEESILSCWTR